VSEREDVEALSVEEREAICRAGFSAYDHLLQRDPTIAAFERILAARLAAHDERVRAEATLAERERIDDALARAGFDTDTPGPIRAAVLPPERLAGEAGAG
jgi:lipopolysaccharide biosynthesis regulator YciM